MRPVQLFHPTGESWQELGSILVDIYIRAGWTDDEITQNLKATPHCPEFAAFAEGASRCHTCRTKDGAASVRRVAQEAADESHRQSQAEEQLLRAQGDDLQRVVREVAERLPSFVIKQTIWRRIARSGALRAPTHDIVEMEYRGFRLLTEISRRQAWTLSTQGNEPGGLWDAEGKSWYRWKDYTMKGHHNYFAVEPMEKARGLKTKSGVAKTEWTVKVGVAVTYQTPDGVPVATAAQLLT